MNLDTPVARDAATAESDISRAMMAIGRAARAAALQLATATTAAKNTALMVAAARLRAETDRLLEANARDLEFARSRKLSAAMIDRSAIDAARVEAMARGLEEVAALPDPVGAVMAEWTRPNGLNIARVRVPLGVIGVIYEARPNVTADAGALCLKAGNAAILRGGSESFHTSAAIMDCLQAGLAEAGLPAGAIQAVPTRDREAVGLMLTMTDYIDIIVPRGGQSLIERVHRESRIPVIAHLQGLCHTYIHAAADPAMAREVTFNAKMRRPGICGATETILIDRAVAGALLPAIAGDLAKAGCELRGDAEARAICPAMIAATDEDWRTEYLDAIVSVRVVDGLDQAIDHVNTLGSHHTDAIITADAGAAAAFLARVDSAIVVHNASTQFADGGEFGMGAEIGISTGRLHARGPVGVEQLTTFKYVVRGEGQVRP